MEQNKIEDVKRKIEETIKTTFSLYGSSYSYHFSQLSEEVGDTVEIPLFNGDKINLPVLQKASKILGVSKEALLIRNSRELGKWYRKYPYFNYLFDYYRISSSKYYGVSMEEKRQIHEPTYKLSDLSYPKDLVERLENLLKSLNKNMPGVYHENAEIMNLVIQTNSFMHFDKMNDFMNSLFDITDSFSNLFFKALKEDLKDEEINEFNLLATALHVIDSLTGNELYYDNLIKVRDVYNSESNQNILDYVQFRKYSSLFPWRCAEFLEDEETVKKFAYYAIDMKFYMRKFAALINKYECEFMWSDARLDYYYAELLRNSLNRSFSSFDDMELPHQTTTVYLDKTDDEVGNDLFYAKKIMDYSRSESEGGIRANPEKQLSPFLNHDIRKPAREAAFKS